MAQYIRKYVYEYKEETILYYKELVLSTPSCDSVAFTQGKVSLMLVAVSTHIILFPPPTDL